MASITQFGKTFKKFGWEVIFVDPDDPRNFARALTPKCKAIFVENLPIPAASSSTSSDCGNRAQGRHPSHRGQHAGDAVPVQPIAWGADIVIHSLTKFLGAHGNSWARGRRFRQVRLAQNDRFGGLTAPEPAYHGLRFYETFGDMALVMHMKAVGLRDLGPDCRR